MGEDVLIQNVLKKVNNGFYVEIGSNEPIQHSNTFGYYLQGWRGITVDANPKMVELHKKIRPKDIAIWTAISDKEEEVVFYEFDMDEISTINENFYLKEKDKQKIVRQTTIKTRTLDSILDEYLPKQTNIDLLSIDVEGHDFQVLQSINLDKYRPKLVVIEMHGFELSNPLNSKIYVWMIKKNYHLIGYAIWNGYFVANEFLYD
ncbi:FkbM family methyltransferase [Spirosoma oryzae]|nr:FkbM family methyltransferase [Spirosoma oryzae]